MISLAISAAPCHRLDRAAGLQIQLCRASALSSAPPQKLSHKKFATDGHQGVIRSARRASTVRTAQQNPTLDHSAGILHKQGEEAEEGQQSHEPGQNGHISLFDWGRQWYPLAFVEDLDPKVPTPVQLLGQRLVLWRDAEQQWRCFADVCPHRMAPLSEGRIEPSDGTLMCSYHGWRFQGDGKCTTVPQALDSKANTAACSSARSCASTRPTQVLQGKVWVWGQGGASAEQDGRLVKPALIPELQEQWPPRGHDGQPWVFFGAQYMRDLPYGWSTLMENILDPSHIKFAHAGVIGDRSEPHWMRVERSTLPDGLPWPDDSIQMAITQHDRGRVQTFDARFEPPCLSRWETGPFKENGKKGIMPMYAVPTAPGQCRFLFSIVIPESEMPWFLRSIFALMPRFHKHLRYTARVLDGDSAILHAQEVIALEESAVKDPDYKKLYFMPAPADRLVAAFRSWLSGRGGGGPVPVTEKKELLPERELLNQYDQHVRHCPSCSKGLIMLQRVRHAAAALCTLCLLAMSTALGKGALLRSSGMLSLATGAAVALAVWLKMGPYIQRFKFTPYDHSA